MFPLKTGLNTVATDPDLVLYKSLTASAMHEIGKRAVLDASTLLFHQQAAEVYRREEAGIPIATAEDGTFILYSPEELEQLKKHIIDIVMKFHIVDENGMVHRLNPLIDYLRTQEPLSQEAIEDPFINAVLNNHKRFSPAIFNQNVSETMKQITDFSAVESLSSDITDQIIRDSYKEDSDYVNVAIWEDDTVQCACEYCEGFFQVVDKMNTIVREDLNPLQQLMLENYNF